MPPSGTDPPFVGRQAEVAALERHLAAAADGAGRAVLVLGEAGLGKTRLVEHAIGRMVSGRVFPGRCHEDGAPAYWPWIEALRPLAESLSDDELRRCLGPGASEVARILPAIRSRLGEPVTETSVSPDGAEARFRLFDALGSFLAAASASGDCVVVVLEDVHWADRESLLLLRYLATEIRRARVLVVGTAREEELRGAAGVPHLLADLVRLVERIPLTGLTTADIGAYALASAGVGPAEALVEAIHRATGGNAFFVTEVVDLLRREQRLSVGTIGDQPLGLPTGVRDAVLRRLEAIDPDTREILETAAVAGNEFEVAVLARATSRPPGETLLRLAPAVERRVLTDAGVEPGRLRFVHALVADALSAGIRPDLLCARHVALADGLEAVHASSLDDVSGDVARHLLAAAPLGTLSRAIAASSRAGDLAMRGLGYEEAASHFGRALDAARADGAPAETRLGLGMSLARARLAASDDDGALAAAVDAAKLAIEIGDTRTLARAAALAGGARSETGQPDPVVIGLLEDAVRAARKGDPHSLAVALPPLSRELYFVDRERRHATSEEGLARARESGDPVLIASALGARHLALWEPGTARERLAIAEEQIELAEANDEFQAAMHAHAWRIADLLELGEVETADDALARYELLAERRRLPRLLWHVAVARTSRLLRLGRLEEAERQARLALSLWQAGPQNNVLQFFAIHLFSIREEQGRLAELDAEIQAFAAGSAVPAWQIALASLHASLGRTDEARRVIRGLAGRDVGGAARGFDALPFDGTWLGGMARLALVCARIGDADSAADLLPRLAPYSGFDVVIGAGVACMGSVARYAGLLALACDRTDEAVAYLRTALEANSRQCLPALTAHAQAELARALRRRGGGGAADELADAALATARALGLGALELEIESEPRPASPAEPLARAERRDRRAALDGDETARGAPASGIGVTALHAGRATLRRDGDLWLIAQGDESTHVRDMKGIAYLAHLLRHPGREFHALDVGGQETSGDPEAGEAPDLEAHRGHRERLLELRGEIEEAESYNDVGRADRLRAEEEALLAELTRALGARGGGRRAGSMAERARLNVTRAIRTAIDHIRPGCPRLAHHLSKSVQTGRFCGYVEDPTFPLTWDL